MQRKRDEITLLGSVCHDSERARLNQPESKNREHFSAISLLLESLFFGYLYFTIKRIIYLSVQAILILQLMNLMDTLRGRVRVNSW